VCCTDVGVAERRRHAVDDAVVQWHCSATNHTRLRLESLPALCCLHHVPCPRILWRPVSVSSSD